MYPGAWVCLISVWFVSACVCVCAYTFERLFLWLDLNAHQRRRDTHLKELPLLFCLKWKLLLLLHSGTRRTGKFRLPRETRGNTIAWKWQAGLTDREEHVSNMPPYASKMSCLGRATCETPFIWLKSIWPFKRKSFLSFTLYLKVFVMVYLSDYISMEYLFTLIYSWHSLTIAPQTCSYKRVWCVDTTWAENRCIHCSVTFG